MDPDCVLEFSVFLLISFLWCHITSNQDTTVGPSQDAKGSPWRHASSSSSCLLGRAGVIWGSYCERSRESAWNKNRISAPDTDFFLLRRSLSAGPRVPVLFIPIGSPEARSSEGVDAGRREVKGHMFKWKERQTHVESGLFPLSSSICLPRDTDPSRPGWPILPFSFFPKSRPMEDLMLFLLLDLWSESWLLLELLPSAERLEETKEITEGKTLNTQSVHYI